MPANMLLILLMLWLKSLLWTSLVSSIWRSTTFYKSITYVCGNVAVPFVYFFQTNVVKLSCWYNPFQLSFFPADISSPEGPNCTSLWLHQMNKRKDSGCLLILNKDEDTDVHIVGTSVFSLNSPGPQTYSTTVRKSFSLVFRGSWFRSLLFSKSILKILFWYWQNIIPVFLCSEVTLLVCLTAHQQTRKGYNLQVSFQLGWVFSDSALHKDFYSQLWNPLPVDWY